MRKEIYAYFTVMYSPFTLGLYGVGWICVWLLKCNFQTIFSVVSNQFIHISCLLFTNYLVFFCLDNWCFILVVGFIIYIMHMPFYFFLCVSFLHWCVTIQRPFGVFPIVYARANIWFEKRSKK